MSLLREILFAEGDYMNREINITVKYNISDENFIGVKITPKETVKKMVEEKITDIFGWDEGFNGIEVTVKDTLIETNEIPLSSEKGDR